MLFRDLGLKVQSGEPVVTLGEPGSGESMLLNTIAGLDGIDSSVGIDGHSLYGLNDRELTAAAWRQSQTLRFLGLRGGRPQSCRWVGNALATTMRIFD